ncbi:hypothetical protein ACP45E_02010, partial [Vibrio genomosp. F10 str. 9ZD137]
AYFDHASAVAYCVGSGGDTLHAGPDIVQFRDWVREADNMLDEPYKAGVGYVSDDGSLVGDSQWWIGGDINNNDDGRHLLYGDTMVGDKAFITAVPDTEARGVALVCAYD